MKTNRALLRSIGLKFYLPARNMFLQTIIVQLFNKKIVQTDYCFFSVNINAIENVRANENFPKKMLKRTIVLYFTGQMVKLQILVRLNIFYSFVLK